MIDIQQGRGVLKTKLGFFYFFMLLDIILCTFVEPHFNTSNSQTTGTINSTVTIVLTIVQIAINLILNVLFFILMWQTVPLRYGMVFDLLKQFKLAIFVNTLTLALGVVERIWRLIILDAGNTNTAVEADQYSPYFIVFCLKYAVYPFFYAILLESSLKLALPVYYNVKKWDSS